MECREHGGVYAVFSSDVMDHNPVPGQGPGLEGIKQSLGGFHSAFPDAQITVEDLIIEGDRAVDRVTFRGTHKGDLAGIPPTGKEIAISAINIWRIAGGKCVEVWHIEDNLSMMMQLGVIPPPGQAGG